MQSQLATLSRRDMTATKSVSMSTSTSTSTSTEFHDANSELFEQRRSLQHRIDDLDRGESAGDPSTMAQLRRLRRQLNDVTTAIVTANLGLVRSYCRRFTSNSTRDDSADFEAAGLLGLIQAINTYDPRQGRFGQWAFKPIQREVLRAVHDADHQNVSMNDFERRPGILLAYRQLQGDHAEHKPSDNEVAEATGAPVTQVRRVIAPPRLESLDAPVGDSSDTADRSVGDTIESPTPGPEPTVVASMTASALRTFGLAALDPRELYVIVRRFGLDGEPKDNLADIGVAIGLSREAVRQLEGKAIAKIKHPLVLRKIRQYDED